MYIVTCGAGFIGSAFVSKLNSQGIDKILLVDELGEGERWKNIRDLKFDDYLHKDKFRKLFMEERLLADVTAIIHMGACSSTTERNADFMLNNNYRYTRDLAEWALRRAVRFIYASSAATYGDGSQGYDDSNGLTPALSPLNVYGYSKQLFDTWALRAGALEKMVGLKFFNVYGPNEYHKADMRSVVLKSYQQIKETGRVRLFKSYKAEFKNGEQSRDFIFIKDALSVIWWFLENRRVNGLFNLGTGKARTWNDLVKGVFAALRKKVNIDYIEMPDTLRDQYQYFTEAKMEKLRSAGCAVKFHSLEEGVKDYVSNYLERGELRL